MHDIYYGHSSGAQPPADTAWLPDGTQLSYRTKDGGLGVINAKTGARTLLTAGAKLKGVDTRPVNEQDRDHRARYSQPDYFWSPNGSEVLYDEDGTLWLDGIRSGRVRQIGDTGQGSGDDAKFSPDGAAISYIHDHNLYTQREGEAAVPLTHTSDPDLRNGETDWVYLEELEVRTNYEWSPDSKRIAYLQMDETKVPTYPITDWIPTHPTIEEQKYPQPGDPNPAVRVGVVSARGGATTWIDIPEVHPNEDYIPREGWVNADTVWIEVLKRNQKHKDIWFANAATGKAWKALAMTDAKFFQDGHYDVDFFAPGKMILSSWRSGYHHLDSYTYDPAMPRMLKLARQLEAGDYTVDKLLSVEGDTVYYLSNESAPLDEQVWAVNLDGTGKHQVTQQPGVHKAEFAKDHSSYTDEFSSLAHPPQIDLCKVGSACVNLWKMTPNADHEERAPTLLTLKAADGRTVLYASLLLPKGAKAAGGTPLINNPYGGPGAATVQDSWGGGGAFDQLLAEHGFAVLHVDNRGMGNRSREFEQAAYRDFGKVQLADQLAAIDQVLAKYPELDPKRLGWWGWSWGGTFTLNALSHSDRFRAGVSVAPVTDFRDYDSIYTERYLGLPSENKAAYDAASVQLSAGQLKGRLFMAFGTGDDNVHMENEVQYVQKLIDADIPYDLQFFPRKTHSIAGATARVELFSRILAQFEQYLMPKPGE